MCRSTRAIRSGIDETARRPDDDAWSVEDEQPVEGVSRWPGEGEGACGRLVMWETDDVTALRVSRPGVAN